MLWCGTRMLQAVPLVIGQFLEMVEENNGIVGSTTGSNYYVRILSTLNRELLKPSSSIAMHRCTPAASVSGPGIGFSLFLPGFGCGAASYAWRTGYLECIGKLSPVRHVQC